MKLATDNKQFSDIPHEICQSETGPGARKSTLILDFSQEDMDAYNQNEGKEYFENMEEMEELMRKVLAVQMKQQEQGVTGQAKDYKLDA